MLIYETTGRIVPEGKPPADVGVIVVNITTVAFIARHLKTGLPFMSKRITVDGGAIRAPKNISAVIGTQISAIADFCGGYKSQPAKILLGGPMMGVAVHDDGYPVMKNTNAVLFLSEREARVPHETLCIHCGRCVRTCPMNLMPLRIDDCFERNDLDGLRRYKVNLCMECGYCSFVCPAKRYLVHMNRLAKVMLREAGRKEKGGIGMTERLTVTSSPHFRSDMSTTRIMLDVIIAFLPTLLASIYLFGYRVITVSVVCVAASILFEYGYQRLLKLPVTIGDASAALTGLLIAFNLSAAIPRLLSSRQQPRGFVMRLTD